MVHRYTFCGVRKVVRIGLAQIDPVMGDISGNTKRIMEIMRKMEDEEVDIAVFPELAITGYPPKDLLLRMDFLQKVREALTDIASFSKRLDLVAIVGFPELSDDVYNSAAVIGRGKVLAVYRKWFLPNYSVFDEHRYFKPGEDLVIIDTKEGTIGITICEDVWNSPGPLEEYAGMGVDGVINISASPFTDGKIELRKKLVSAKAYEHHMWIIYLNTFGGQDELVFDGASFVASPTGVIYHELPPFEEKISTVDIDLRNAKSSFLLDPRERFMRKPAEAMFVSAAIKDKSDLRLGEIQEPMKREEQLLRALMTALKDYTRKNGFERVVVGLSGGIDSSLVAAISALALGKENVLGVLMPSMYTSSHSIEDAQNLAKNLGIETVTIPITDVFKSYEKALEEVFKGREPDVTEENIQARIRGNYLMAISNKFGHLVVTTGNKSEYATGYATLYGDMAGGYALLKDLYKTDVYRVARHINEREGREIIPKRVFEKPPSAELRPNQTDQDKLPPYEILDGILRLFIDEGKTPQEIISAGYDKSTVEYVLRLVKSSEYKRYQSAPGPKITTRLFGLDWRQPITNKFTF